MKKIEKQELVKNLERTKGLLEKVTSDNSLISFYNDAVLTVHENVFCMKNKYSEYIKQECANEYLFEAMDYESALKIIEEATENIDIYIQILEYQKALKSIEKIIEGLKEEGVEGE